MLLGKVDICLQKTRNSSMSFTLYNINLEWIKDLNVRPRTLKQLQEARGNTLKHLGIRNNCLNRTPVAQKIRERINKLDCIKLKKLLHNKWNSPTELEEIFASCSSDKWLISRTYRTQKYSTHKESMQWRNGHMNREFSKERDTNDW
jgi:hypothetical protein